MDGGESMPLRLYWASMRNILFDNSAGYLIMKAFHLPTVQKLMGHADIQTTMIYSHLAADHLAEAVEKLEFK